MPGPAFSILLISRSASRLDQVLQGDNLALLIRGHALLARGEASLGIYCRVAALARLTRPTRLIRSTRTGRQRRPICLRFQPINGAGKKFPGIAGVKPGGGES